ncbi:MAG TPA: hypothetical protein VGG86_13980 [Roseiarcus sp.]|jgi:hypothetical protein
MKPTKLSLAIAALILAVIEIVDLLFGTRWMSVVQKDAIAIGVTVIMAIIPWIPTTRP